MSWAAKRRFIILLIVGAIVAVLLTIASFKIFYKAPSCTDSSQNQGEAGIDCGGPCAFLCTAQEQPPTVLFTKAIQNNSGRTDVVASIENKNATAAAKDVPYTITLYGAGQSLIQQTGGTLDLPPGATALVYLPGIVSGKQTVVNAFLEVASSSPKWFTLASDPRIVPAVSNTTFGGTLGAPRIEALLTNPSITVLTNVRVIILIHGTTGDVIAASQTIVPVIGAQGSATATFTWSSAFPSAPARVEVVPIIPLP